MDQPAAIQALPVDVVHRIAAGEVVQRPVSAVKEMVENSIDAGAKHVTVTLKEGGLKLLQIQDDGCGVRFEDLPILCRRHTTSKLRAYEDLDTIDTLGFRGEALASISYVAHMSATTMTVGAAHGLKALYKDGELLPPGPKPVATVRGTIITVEDMFYNVPARRKAFRSPLEEQHLVADLLQRYAVFKTGVGFTLKRQGEPRPDLHTLPGATRLDTIRSLYGGDLAAALLPIRLEAGPEFDAATGLEAGMAFRAEGYISGLTYAARKGGLLLFINGRPVECPGLKRCMEAVYMAHNPKVAKPWAFLDLRLPPRHVEVNVHPTKREVGFLHQDAVVDAIAGGIEHLLAASMGSRTFAAARPSGTAGLAEAAAAVAASAAAGTQQQEGGAGAASQPAPSQPSYYRPEKLVRSDHRTQTMDAFVVTRPAWAAAAAAAAGVSRKRPAGGDRRDRGGPVLTTADPQAAAAEAAAVLMQQPAEKVQRQQARLVKQRRNPSTPTHLTSVAELLAEAEAGAHEGLAELFRDHVWVGLASSTQALVQAGTRLYLIDLTRLSTDLFYQQMLRRFERAERLRLATPLPVAGLMLAALQVEAAGRWRPEDGPMADIADLAAELMRQKGAMLAEYFGLEFVECDASDHADQQQQQQRDAAPGQAGGAGGEPQQAAPEPTPPAAAAAAPASCMCLAALPLLVDGYAPDLGRLPDLLLALSRDVDWGDERACFQGVAQAIAALYAVQPLPAEAAEGAAAGASQEEGGALAAAVPPSTGDAPMEEAAASQPPPGGPPATAMDVDSLEGAEGAEGGQPAPAAAEAEAAAAGAGPYSLAAHTDLAARAWTAKHVLLPCFRMFLAPPRQRARDGTVVLLTSMERLYRVFERCF